MLQKVEPSLPSPGTGEGAPVDAKHRFAMTGADEGLHAASNHSLLAKSLTCHCVTSSPVPGEESEVLEAPNFCSFIPHQRHGRVGGRPRQLTPSARITVVDGHLRGHDERGAMGM